MINSKCEAGTFQIRTEKRYSPYNSQAILVHCGQFLLFVIQSARPVANRVVASVVLLLKKYTPNLFITSVSIERVLVLCFW